MNLTIGEVYISQNDIGDDYIFKVVKIETMVLCRGIFDDLQFHVWKKSQFILDARPLTSEERAEYL